MPDVSTWIRGTKLREETKKSLYSQNKVFCYCLKDEIVDLISKGMLLSVFNSKLNLRKLPYTLPFQVSSSCPCLSNKSSFDHLAIHDPVAVDLTRVHWKMNLSLRSWGRRRSLLCKDWDWNGIKNMCIWLYAYSCRSHFYASKGISIYMYQYVQQAIYNPNYAQVKVKQPDSKSCMSTSLLGGAW